ncbi:hypothetical protein IGI04_024201, partial [Brassica rapa subsp. trilocularis]
SQASHFIIPIPQQILLYFPCRGLTVEAVTHQSNAQPFDEDIQIKFKEPKPNPELKHIEPCPNKQLQEDEPELTELELQDVELFITSKEP